MGSEIARVEKGKFAPGTSGNPGGRPKLVKEVVELARQHVPEVVEKLMDIVRNGRNDMARVKAAEILLNRAYGAPAIAADPDGGLPGGEIPRFVFVLGDNDRGAASAPLERPTDDDEAEQAGELVGEETAA